MNKSKQNGHNHPPYIKLPLKSLGSGAVSSIDNCYIRVDIVLALAPHVREDLFALFECKKNLTTAFRTGIQNRRHKLWMLGLDVEGAHQRATQTPLRGNKA